jgi:DNA repair exonuclease SbcCD ATPase subunit
MSKKFQTSVIGPATEKGRLIYKDPLTFTLNHNVRYLGIIQRKSKTFLGQQELHLLAKEEGEYVWKATQGQFSSDLLSRFGLGAMVIAEITQAGQLQRVEDAAPHLVAILQGFVRYTDNLRNQSSEVDLWRNALDLQAKAVSDREQELMDWENRLALFQQELGIQQTPSGGIALGEHGALRGDGDDAESSKLRSVLAEKEQQLIGMRDELEALKNKVQGQDEHWQTLQVSNATLQAELEQAHERYEQLTWAQQNQPGQSADALASVDSQLVSLQEILQAQQLHQQDKHQSFYGLLEDLDKTLADLQAQAQHVAEVQRDHQAETLNLAALYQELQSQNQETLAQSLQWEQTEGVFQAYGQHYEKYQHFLKSLGELYTQQRQASVLLEEQVGPTGPDVSEMLSPELGRKRQDLRRDAKQVEDQEHELMEIEQQVQNLQDRVQLMQKEGASADDIEEIKDDLDFQQQRCQILREGLLPQQQRLRQAQADLQQQIDLFLKKAGIAPMPSPSSEVLEPLVHQMAERVHQLAQYLKAQEEDLASWWQQVQEQQQQHQQQKGLWQELTEQLAGQEVAYQEQWRAYQDQQQQLQEKILIIQQTQEGLLYQRSALATFQDSLNGNLEQPLQMLQVLLREP